jgi:hypothetical protein
MRHTDVVELIPGSMATADMLADNPGTWLLHCHVSDHMEAGMMATFTIYEPARRSCPLKFVSGDFWNAQEKDKDKFSVTVQNSSAKAIRSFTLMSEHLLGPEYLHRPFADAKWEATGEILPPGQQQFLSKKAYTPEQSKQIVGWVFFPSAITYNDGTTWKPQQDAECFQVFWREPDHPSLIVLPPLQVDLDQD